MLYIKLNKVMYGCIRAAILVYDSLSQQLESMGFVINPYDMRFTNKIINGKNALLLSMKMIRKYLVWITSLLMISFEK